MDPTSQEINDMFNQSLEVFYMAGLFPGAWYHNALRLKKVTDLVFTQVEKDVKTNDVELDPRQKFLLEKLGTIWFSLEPKKEGFILSTPSAFDPIYWFLAGVTIENLLKGLFVARHPELLISNGQMKIDDKKIRQLFTHDIDFYAKKVSGYIELSNDELTLIKMFKRFIIWMGRYPVPKNITEFLDDMKTMFGTRGTQHGLSREKLPIIFEGLYEKLEHELVRFKDSPSIKVADS